MKKHRFSYRERYAVWFHHGKQCYYCAEPLRFLDVTIDHVLPERLLDTPTELQNILEQFGLPFDFEINSYKNWLPCHNRCNTSKSGKIFKPTPLILAILEKLTRDFEKVKQVENRTRDDRFSDELLGKVSVALESGQINDRGILAAVANHYASEKEPITEDAVTIAQEYLWHLDPERWIVLERQGDIAFVSNGKSYGRMPITKNPDISWLCPFCDNYGPWNGARCMTCNRMSEPSD